MKKTKILYVDDEAANLSTFAMALKDDYEVITAGSGKEALKLFKKGKNIEIVIADQRMPEMSGVELLEQIHAINPDPIRMILTAYIDVEDIISAINRGHVYNYIIKPWEEENLRITLKQAHESYVLAKENRQLVKELEKKNKEMKKLNKQLEEDIEARKQTEEELESRTIELEEANIATKILLKQGAEAKKEMENKVLSNIKDLVLPYVEELGEKLTDRRELIYINVIKANIDQITSSFSQSLSAKAMGLTPREIQVADLVRQGRTNREIGELLKLSTRTVEFYRDNLRKKFGLKNMKVNLRSYLLSLN
jgi:DNA-binding NarL/FixJ family response regulator